MVACCASHALSNVTRLGSKSLTLLGCELVMEIFDDDLPAVRKAVLIKLPLDVLSFVTVFFVDFLCCFIRSGLIFPV